MKGSLQRGSALMLALLLGLSPAVCAAEDTSVPPTPNSSTTQAQSSDPLLQILVAKGVLTAQEAKYVASGSPDHQREKLIFMLKQKGLLDASEVNTLTSVPSSSVAVPVSSTAPAVLRPAVLTSTAPAAPQTPAKTETKPPAPKVIPAVAPLRVLQVEGTKKDGLIPDIKLGSGARMKLYGMVKASAIYDSSSPYGTDMPLPGFIGVASGKPFETGPNGSPEFHVKARFLRIGSNFEWPDASEKLAFTGKMEFDFEGNFTRTLNRNVSTVRSSQASIRLAWGRMDYKTGANSTWFLLAGQDWTPFGSSTLPNLVETTGLGLGYGTLYERAAQVRTGFAFTVPNNSRKLTFMPEFAIVMPAFGNNPTSVDDQLGYGERQGADSGRPEVQGRFVTQFQLDKAPGVVPAQLIASFVQGKRTAIVTAADVPNCTLATCPSASFFKNAYSSGARVSSNRWGMTGEVQLPTRYVTVIGKYFYGEDLRWYFVGSLLSFYNDINGLTNLTKTTSIDGSSAVFFGMDSSGKPTIAPQKPVRSTGGFVNVAFPLSRIFHADPAGHNAGWQWAFHYSFDNAYAADARRTAASATAAGLPTVLGNCRNKDDLAATTLNWKVNPFVTFALEQSMYRTRMAGGTTAWGSATGWPIVSGHPARSWHDTRTEFSTIFTF